jgi:hypothetical protein
VVVFAGERGKENGMIGKKGTDKVDEAVEKLTGVVQGSYKAAVENTTAVQESNVRLARSFFKGNVEMLKAQAEIQTEIGQYTLQSMAEQVRKHREAFLEMSRESLNAYDGFLDSLSSYYREVSSETEEPGE